jgi:hypothetical protein
MTREGKTCKAKKFFPLCQEHIESGRVFKEVFAPEFLNRFCF